MTVAHAGRAHAKLPPSAAHRWMMCPASVRFCADIVETPSVFAAEGTAAHVLAEKCLVEKRDAASFKGWTIDVAVKNPALAVRQGGMPNGKSLFRVDAEMIDAVQLYVDVVREIEAIAEELEIECRLDVGNLVPGVFGTGDAVAYVASHPDSGKRRVVIADLKYGKGIAVEVESNEQALTYGAGVLQRYHNRGVDEVELIIVQPRAPHRDGPVRRWVTDTLTLYEHIIAMQAAAEAAADPNPPFVPGTGCTFCRGAGKCAALRNKVREITVADPKAPFKDWKLEQADLNLVKTWMKRREEFAHSEALRGHMPPGAKLVAKRATRRWKDEDTAAGTLSMMGVPDDEIYERTVLSPAQAEKVIPAKHRGALADLIVKVSGGTVLAPLSDPRAAVDPNDASGFEAVEVSGAGD